MRNLLVTTVVVLSLVSRAAAQPAVGTWRGPAVGPGDFVEEVTITKSGKGWIVQGQVLQDKAIVGKYSQFNSMALKGGGLQVLKFDKAPPGWDGVRTTVLQPAGEALGITRAFPKKFEKGKLDPKEAVASKEPAKTPKAGDKTPAPAGAARELAAFPTSNSLAPFTAFLAPDGKQVGFVPPQAKNADLVAIHDVDTKELVRTFPVPGPVVRMHLANDGSRGRSSTRSRRSRFSWSTRRPEKPFAKSSSRRCFSAARSPATGRSTADSASFPARPASGLTRSST